MCVRTGKIEILTDTDYDETIFLINNCNYNIAVHISIIWKIKRLLISHCFIAA